MAAMNKIYETFKQLPPWAKGVVGVGAALGIFFVGKKLYHIVFPSEAEKRNATLLKGIDADISRWKSEGMQPSFASAEYQTDANAIYDGMRNVFSDNYEIVETTLKKMRHNLDVALLMKAFGTRQDYDVFGFATGDPKDLFTFVNSELGNHYGMGWLTGNEVDDINSDWSKRGIIYQI